MSTDHDAAYKQLFAHPEMVRDLLQGFLPQPWVRALDLNAFERVNASYVSDGGQQRHTDRVWKLRLGDDCCYVYMLLEFQSRSHPWMALRMQVYVGLLLEDLVKRHELSAAGKLPPVLPLVLYNGAPRWSASTDLSSLMQAPPDGLAWLQPEQKYLLIDQNHHAKSAGTVQHNLVLSLFRLERSRTVADIFAVVTELARWLAQPDYAPLSASLTRWVMQRLRRKFTSATLAWPDNLTEVVNMDIDEPIFETFEEGWEYNGIQKGLKQGLEQGLEQGRLAADRNRLAQWLGKRFGTLPANVLAQIDSADQVRLDDWFERCYDASQLADLFD